MSMGYRDVVMGMGVIWVWVGGIDDDCYIFIGCWVWVKPSSSKSIESEFQFRPLET